MDLKEEIYSYGQKAKDAAIKLATASTKEKNNALKLMAEKLRENMDLIHHDECIVRRIISFGNVTNCRASICHITFYNHAFRNLL